MTTHRLLLLLFFLTSARFVQATDCSYHYFIEKHVNLSVCRNHGRFSTFDILYYKGAAKSLSDYIAIRIKQGELENKNFEIELYDPILSQPQLLLTQGKKGYHIMAQHLRIEQLMQLADEFSKPEFKILNLNVANLYGEENEKQYNRIISQMENILDRELSTDMKNVLTKTHTLWEQGALKIQYAKGELYYELHGKRLNEQVNGGMPGVIQNRYILQLPKHFVVYEDSLLCKKIEIDNSDIWYGDMSVEVTGKWINFLYWDEYRYSYSYDKNRFYKVEKSSQ
ncbi:hypothetical protein [Bacteroides sp. 224]|uniref:hypothetical protein n=1 Tax=Bacteroides sp. 224 TaxID=2302936 RepID=UPI0013D34212|nr:hypothetical protein [Bacteroides sp. 224]NDV65841.1 hypothetical protein [Bacteroides sp. 224]